MRYRSLIWLLIFYLGTPFFGKLLTAQDLTNPSPISVRFVGSILDADTQQPIPARVYLLDAEGNHLFVRSANEGGSAWPYAEQWVPMPQSVEQHTTVSAHPFTIDLPPGHYTIVVERGKEYLPHREVLHIAEQPVEQTFRLQRWSDMAAQGWYSGETHVHRRLAELPNVMAAEELNVAFPVTFWTTSSDQAPNLEPSSLRSQGPSPFGPRVDMGADPIWINDSQVILPRNTEYEIFSIGSQRHTLGALFILNHRTPFTHTVPPIGPVVEQARREGALLDLDKHNWPWSLMLIPIAGVDLFELSNNSVWRTRFGFKQAGQPLPPWHNFEQEAPGVLTEWGWLEFGFEMYYALLNCGFRLSPTAGTASGVHPVPLGFSRVYVHTGDKFDLDTWLDGLRRGRSFVTTGPMLIAHINGQLPGQVFELDRDHSDGFTWEAEVLSPDPISRIEVLVNGSVVQTITPPAQRTASGAWKWVGQGRVANRAVVQEAPSQHRSEAVGDEVVGDESRGNETIGDAAFSHSGSYWVVIRTWSDQPDGRKRFAHTGAWHFEVDGQGVRPPRPQIDYLVAQIEQSIQQQQGILPPAALAEFARARDTYRQIQALAYVDPETQRRPVGSATDQRFWLENMAIWHQYSLIEMSQVLGQTPAQIRQQILDFQLHEISPQDLRPTDRLAIMPYPGGRHPRRGFLDGAIAPQRDTKFSLFTPWSPSSYIVADVPEAIFSNLGLTYLAHTHIPTLWDLQGKTLPAQEWQRQEAGVLQSQRELPNGIRFDVRIEPLADHVRMELAVFNGTSETLTDLRVQHCLMLARATEFDQGSNDNKIFHDDYALVHDPHRTRWLITSWKPLGRAWGNPPVPCLHADPQLPDCEPGATTRAHGWLSFFEGEDWQAEVERIEALRWWEPATRE